MNLVRGPCSNSILIYVNNAKFQFITIAVTLQKAMPFSRIDRKYKHVSYERLIFPSIILKDIKTKCCSLAWLTPLTVSERDQCRAEGINYTIMVTKGMKRKRNKTSTISKVSKLNVMFYCMASSSCY